MSTDSRTDTAESMRPMLINGELVSAADNEWLEVTNPADEEILGQVPRGKRSDIERAVNAALAAAPAWASTEPVERGARLRELGARLTQRAAEILHVEVMDTGNTITPMRGDVATAVADLDYYAGLGYEIKGETVPSTAGNLHLTIREPYGVVGRIVPFNHPIMFAASRTAAALVAGNCVVLKPPETSPLSSTIFAEICRDVLPAGVMNVVTGLGGEAGDALARHPEVKRIAFTGSVATGLQVQRSAADTTVKHVTLELGGKNPLIIMPDAHVESAAKSAVAGMNFAWQGQSCGATSRVLVHESLYDEVVERIVADVSRITVGDPLREDTGMGPINSRAQYEKVRAHIQSALDEGATLATGGGRPEGEEFRRGYWIEPTVFTGVTCAMRIAREEVFGPVLSILRWREEDEAIAVANATSYGLTTSIWTESIANAVSMARRCRAGYLWINGVGRHFRGMPFGGMKASGIGREEAGIDEILSFTETKAVNIMVR